jgi:MFS family permease
MHIPMKRSTTFFLRAVLFLIGAIVLGLCVFLLPYGIMTDQVGYYRPILIGMYIPAIPFFFALFQSWKLLNYIDSNSAFSQLSVKSLKNIKYCGLAISGLYTLGMPYIFYAADRDDAPGVVGIALVIIFASFVIAVFAGLLQKLLQNAIRIKEENDLTV